jgi:hypothetical protein
MHGIGTLVEMALTVDGELHAPGGGVHRAQVHHCIISAHGEHGNGCDRSQIEWLGSPPRSGE